MGGLSPLPATGVLPGSPVPCPRHRSHTLTLCAAVLYSPRRAAPAPYLHVALPCAHQILTRMTEAERYKPSPFDYPLGLMSVERVRPSLAVIVEEPLPAVQPEEARWVDPPWAPSPPGVPVPESVSVGDSAGRCVVGCIVVCSLGGPDAAAGGPDAVGALSPPVPGRIVYEFPTPTSETSGLGLGGLDALQALLTDVATAEGAAPVLLSMEPALSYRLTVYKHPDS